MNPPKDQEGIYWVRCDGDDEWGIASWEGGEWYVIGYESFVKLDVVEYRQIYPPNRCHD